MHYQKSEYPIPESAAVGEELQSLGLGHQTTHGHQAAQEPGGNRYVWHEDWMETRCQTHPISTHIPHFLKEKKKQDLETLHKLPTLRDAWVAQ